MQKTREKSQLECVKNSKFFYKRETGISPHSNLTKSKKYRKVTKPNTKTNSTNTKNQNQINTLK